MKCLFWLVVVSVAGFAQVSHPRIWLDSTTMTRLRAQIATSHYNGTAVSDAPQFTAFLASANALVEKPVAPYDRNAMPNGSIYYNYMGSDWYAGVQTLGLAYQVTRSVTYSNKVKQILGVMADNGRILSLTSVSGVVQGMTVSGTNIPPGTTVLAIYPSGNSFNRYPQVRLSAWYSDTIPGDSTITFGGAVQLTTPPAGTSYSNFGPQDPQRNDSGYPDRNIVCALALGYDWVYDQLSSVEKSDYAHILDVWWAQVNYSGYQWASAKGGTTDNGCGNYGVSHLSAFSLAAIAFEGDDPTVTDIFYNSSHGVVTRLNSRFLPAMTSGCFASGYPSESYSYGNGTLLRLIATLWAYQTSGKAHLIGPGGFDWMPWLRQVALASIYNQRPDNWGLSDEGDWAGDYTGIMWQTLPYVTSAMLGTGTPEGGYALFQANNINFSAIPGGTPLASYGFSLSAFNAFLFFQPGAVPADYRAVLPTYWFGNAPGDYHTFSRTDWSNTAIQTSFAGTVGQSTDHQAFNAGHIYLQRGADRLLINSGQWRDTIGVVGTPSPFTGRNWALNTLYVDDSTLTATGYRYCADAYPGCQRGGASMPVPVHRESAEFVYSKADLTSAYAMPGWQIVYYPLSVYTRSFVSISGVSFVYDYAVAAHPAGSIRNQYWHTPALSTASPAGLASAISVNGNIASATVGASTIWIKSLLPTAPSIASTTDLLGYTGAPTGTQHFEISDMAQANSPITVYLTVLAPTDSFVAAMPSTMLISPSGFRGAFYDDGAQARVALFSSDGTPRSSCAYTIAAQAPSVRHVIADLAQGTYNVRKQAYTIVAGFLVGGDGTLTFESRGGGSFSVELADAPPPRSPAPRTARKPSPIIR